ncbi:type II secretion system protein, partial [Candidatus Fermentibacterales bacterium]|nr:type II secretion system protein [Candidatus Fermentibacterales bacterium]
MHARLHAWLWCDDRRRAGGFTLPELVIVIAVVGVLLAAIYLVFHSGREAGRQISDSHDAEVAARLAVEELETYLKHAGYTGVAPAGEWHPLRSAGRDRIVFVANLENPGSFGPEDTLTVEWDSGGRLVVSNASGETLYQGGACTEVSLSYLDGTGTELSGGELSTQEGLDRVRQIAYRVSTGDGGFVMPGLSTPRNLAFAGESPDFMASFLPERFSGGNDISFFEETWESPGYYSFYDTIEAEPGWVPIIIEDFETAASWTNNWVLYSSETNGRIRRYADAGAHGGSYDLAMDASPAGLVNLNGAIWRVDLTGYDEFTDSLRLHWFWMENNDEADSEDGVFFPDFLGGSETLINSEDFSGFRFDLRSDWEYWNTTYGNVRVLDNAWSQP